MFTTLDPLQIRRRLDRKVWGVPVPFGPDGWLMDTIADEPRQVGRIIITAADHPESGEWWHASISRVYMPTYDDLAMLHKAVWPVGWAYQCFAPPEHHVNIAEYALHLWGRPDGEAMLPNFGELGSI